MPIWLLIDNSENSYLATDAAILVEAFEGALRELGLADRDDLATLVVANQIITFAKAGVLDPARLHDLTLKAIRREQQQPLTASLLAVRGRPISVDQPMSRDPVARNVTSEAADA